MRKSGKAFLTAAFLGITVLTGCGNGAEAEKQTESTEKATIICTVFPEYDWVCAILGDLKEEYDVQLLLNSGVDIHSYQPTAEDIARISKCDLFVYTGGVSENWIEDTLKGAVNDQMQVVTLMDELGERVKTEEIVEGMEHHHEDEGVYAEDGHAHVDEEVYAEDGHVHEGEEGLAEDEHAHEEATGYDEHVWLSLKNAEILVDSLAEALALMDEENAGVFEENAAAYIEKLEQLDGAYEKAVEEAELDTLLFGDRFPFRYLTEDYGLNYYAAFTGCSAETEASFETIAFLAEKLDELELPAVMVIESSDQKLAQTIIGSTQKKDQRILVMNSLQSVNRTDMENGASYLSIMEENLEVLKEALN